MKERIEALIKVYEETSTPESAKNLFRLHNEIYPKQKENLDSISCYGCRNRVMTKIKNYLDSL